MNHLHKPAISGTSLSAVDLYRSETATPPPPPSHGVRVLFIEWDNVLSADQMVLPDIIGHDARFDLAHSDTIDLGISAPLTAGFLHSFDAVLIGANTFDGGVIHNVSNVLKDFVDQGGGVVLSTFWGYFDGIGAFQDPHGGINGPGYNPLTRGTSSPEGFATVGQVFDPNSPIMAGVNGGTIVDFRGDYAAGSLDAGAQLIANWSDGRPLAAINAAGNVATVTFDPLAVSPTFGNSVGAVFSTGDLGLLMANALDTVAGN
jgi:hypothetical protein